MSQKIKYFTAGSFINPSYKFLSYGFFTRHGGVSAYPYEGLNCGIGSGDSCRNIQGNRRLVASEIGMLSENLLSPFQTHSANVLYVKEPWDVRPKADGLVTDCAGLGLGILTADCAPVLFFGKKKNGQFVIGAAHAGWKGALTGVLDNTIDAMVKLGSQKSQIRACIGPCISKSSYEVGTDFIESFLEECGESEKFFQSKAKSGGATFDLSAYCAWRLFRRGIGNISLLDIDTYSREEEFFSYRRAVHREENDYGRQISVICINK